MDDMQASNYFRINYYLKIDHLSVCVLFVSTFDQNRVYRIP
jgi:hypothetical protein